MKKGPSEVRFEFDHMLVKLGKYLRILGYDAAWEPGIRTHELIHRANREGRVFVTRNRQIREQYPPAREAVVLAEDDPVEQLRALGRALDLDLHSGLFSKCIRCNVPLDAVPDKAAVRARVHPNVFDRYDRFFTCPACGTVFWHGSHVRNTCRKLGVPLPEEGERPTSTAERPTPK